MTVTDRKATTLKRLRAISHLLDNAIAIPGTKYRVGIDPLLGLIPGGGDTVSALFSAYIIWEAAMLGLPRETLTRMFYNVLFDTVAGSVPVAGDILDVAWKANTKNVGLLEAHLHSPEPSKKADKWFIILLAIGLILFVAVVASISAFLIGAIIGLFTGSR